MEAVVPRPIAFFTKRRVMGVAVVALSCLLTAMMSLLFHHTIRADMMATGLIAALIINQVVERVSRSYRRVRRGADDHPA